METARRWKSILMVVAGHLLLLSLSMGCDGRRHYDIESGWIHLHVPNRFGDFRDRVTVGFETSEIGDYAEIYGGVEGTGCQVTVLLCDGGGCSMTFRGIVPSGERIHFEDDSDHNGALDHFVGKFDGGCSGLCMCGPRNVSHDIDLMMESDGCEAWVDAMIGMDVVEDDDY